MPEREENLNEVYTFEFYEDDYTETYDLKETKVIEEYNEIDFESDLNDEQLEIVNNLKGPMLVIAGAGSGKTRTIVYSVAKLLVSRVKPSEIMLVTFTNKAANEMIKRVETLLGKKPKGIWAGTFHSMANRFLRMYAKKLGLKPNYTIMDESDSKTLMRLAIDKANVKEVEERFPTAVVAKEILSFSINCNKSIREVIQWKYYQFDSDPVVMKLSELFTIYKKKKEQDNLVDFDDLLVFWNALLEERNIAQMIARRIKYVLVDEYQDTNHIQDEIIHKIVKQNPNYNVMVVGDDAQSIYAFRGANFQNILEFENKYQDCQRRTITYNYRSVPQILDLANDSIKHNKKQFKKTMRPTRPKGIIPFQVNVADDKDQARFIANQILKLRSNGYALNEIAILVRASHHSMQIEIELKTKNIPYEVRAGVAFFEKAHIKDMIAHLRVIENPYDEISWSRIFSIIPGIGKISGTKLFEAIAKTPSPINHLVSKTFAYEKDKVSRISKEAKKNTIAHVKNLLGLSIEDNPGDIIKKLIPILEDHLQSKYDNWKDRIDDLEQLAVYSQNFTNLRNFLENLSLNLSNLESKTVQLGDQTEEEKPLVISTIHRAKGLEWRVIFIPMLCEDSFPSSRVLGDPESYEEERRVFYVAITRAKDLLYLISPAVIHTYRGLQTVRLSQFVAELNPKIYTKSSVQFKSKRRKKATILKANFKTANDLL
ncbi:MAG: ATP-dependent helicase [Candidatus Heimdallarchaeota archaeon]